jgi:hypothetical protein
VANLKQRQRAGRPRKPGLRTKAGRPKPAGDKGAPTTWRRILDEGVALGLDPRLGTELGRLALHGLLSETQVTAGTFIAGWYAQAAKAIRPPRRMPASPDLNAGRWGNSDLALELLTEDELDRMDRARWSARPCHQRASDVPPWSVGRASGAGQPADAA